MMMMRMEMRMKMEGNDGVGGVHGCCEGGGFQS